MPTGLRLLVVAHVLAGLAAVLLGAAAILGRKAPDQHPRRGRRYLIALAVVVATGAGIATTDWRHTWPLALLGAVALALAAVGHTAHRALPGHGLPLHIVAMSGSYVAMLTAFYVDNGPRLPLWNQLPPGSFWLLPTLLAIPPTLRSLRRNSPGQPRRRPPG